MIYSLIKPILMGMDPEDAHDLALKVARLSPGLGQLSGATPSERLITQVGSLRWSSPVGLAAGLDKNADALPFFTAQGFGAVEVGTVTLRPQLGNPKPRLFRYQDEESLRNAMGFPNRGLLDMLPRLESHDRRAPVGVNMGKNKESNREESIEELSTILGTLTSEADYFVVNVSSPNTPGLRDFQERGYLTELFTELKRQSAIDLYLKIAPDIDDAKLSELSRIALEQGLTGLIATNTTIMPERGAGGVSGRILRMKSRNISKKILDQKEHLELISVGGYSCPKDVFDYWSDGGKALQIYTAYIYQGPTILKNIYQSIEDFLEVHKLKDLEAFFALSIEERKRLASLYSQSF